VPLYEVHIQLAFCLVHVPLVSSDTPRTKTSKLSGVQGTTNKRMKNERKKLDASSSKIINVIKNISTLEKMMMEMIQRITTHIFRVNK
jgi:hypothetical protein